MLVLDFEIFLFMKYDLMYWQGLFWCIEEFKSFFHLLEYSLLLRYNCMIFIYIFDSPHMYVHHNVLMYEEYTCNVHIARSQ